MMIRNKFLIHHSYYSCYFFTQQPQVLTAVQPSGHPQLPYKQGMHY